MILALQTTTFSEHGGIPVYNRMVCRALNELNELSNLGFDDPQVLVAMDRRSDVGAVAAQLPNLNLEAFDGNRPAFVRRVMSTALRRQVDLALIGHVNYAPLALMLKRLRPGFRYGVMVHGVEVWSHLSRMKRAALRGADFVVSVSDYTARQVCELSGVDRDRIYILPNTVTWRIDSGTALPKVTKAKVTRDRPTVRLLSVCRLDARERYKGVETVIEALPKVLALLPELEYVVVGSGSDLDRHVRLAASLGVSDHIRFLGATDDAALRQCYQDCDVFILPSNGEGFGIVYLEAMAHAKPVIAADCRAVPEVVKHGETGLLVDYGNVEQIANAIETLARDRSRRYEMGAAGLRRLQEHFTFELFKERLRDLLAARLMNKAMVNAQLNPRDIARADL